MVTGKRIAGTRKGDNGIVAEGSRRTQKERSQCSRALLLEGVNAGEIEMQKGGRTQAVARGW